MVCVHARLFVCLQLEVVGGLWFFYSNIIVNPLIVLNYLMFLIGTLDTRRTSLPIVSRESQNGP